MTTNIGIVLYAYKSVLSNPSIRQRRLPHHLRVEALIARVDKKGFSSLHYHALSNNKVVNV